jgi:hypothetical protein
MLFETKNDHQFLNSTSDFSMKNLGLFVKFFDFTYPEPGQKTWLRLRLQQTVAAPPAPHRCSSHVSAAQSRIFGHLREIVVKGTVLRKSAT